MRFRRDRAAFGRSLDDFRHVLLKELLGQHVGDRGKMDMLGRTQRKHAVQEAIKHCDQRLPLALFLKPELRIAR